MYKIVLVRHGESVWNKENLFTGWTDVDLSEKGVEEARQAGIILRENGYGFDYSYTSLLKRSIKTLNIILEVMDLLWLPVEKSWRLNERHYGALQGLNKAETALKYGTEQVKLWRRSYTLQPPMLEVQDVRNPIYDIRYSQLNKEECPLGESLEMTITRFLPYWEKVIAPTIKAGKRIIISAHGNSLRALIKNLDRISDNKIAELEIPTGKPLVYTLDNNLMPIEKRYLT